LAFGAPNSNFVAYFEKADVFRDIALFIALYERFVLLDVLEKCKRWRDVTLMTRSKEPRSSSELVGV
jgi:hypothetical protein